MRHLQRWMSLLLVLMTLGTIVRPMGAMAVTGRPSMISITSGQQVGTGLTYQDTPFIATFSLNASNMPLESCRLGIHSYDCDSHEVNSYNTSEYDRVYVNDVFVGIVTGVDNGYNLNWVDVPLDTLKLGENTIRVEVGEKHVVTGNIGVTTYWVLGIDAFTVELDGGRHGTLAPDEFSIELVTAKENPTNIECEARLVIKTTHNMKYKVEYSLIDKNPDSATCNMMMANDAELVSGTDMQSTGRLFLSSAAHRGQYEIQAALMDPVTQEVYDYAYMVFTLSSVLCDHHAIGEEKFWGMEYRLLAQNDEMYPVEHRVFDMYQSYCSKCGTTFFDYRNMRNEEHEGDVCICGYVQPDYEAIGNVMLYPLGESRVGGTFQLLVYTKPEVDRIEAVNDVGVPLNMPWFSFEQDDMRIWSTEYEATATAAARVWTVKAYNANNRYLGKKDSNALEIVAEHAIAPEPDMTRCQRALLGWATLTGKTSEHAAQLLEASAMDWSANRVWHIFAKQAIDICSNKGAVGAISGVQAIADPYTAFLEVLNWGGKNLYTEKQMEEMTIEMWQYLIRSKISREAMDDTAGADDVALTVGGVSAGVEIANMLLSKDVSDIWKIVDDLDAGTVLSGGWAFVQALDAGCQARQQIVEIKQEYLKMVASFDRAMNELQKMQDDASRSGNEELRTALENVQTRMWDEALMQKDAVLNTFWYISEQKQAFDEAGLTKMLSGVGSIGFGALTGVIGGIPSFVAQLALLFSDNDEVFQAAVELLFVYHMSQSFELYSYNTLADCNYHYNTYQMMAYAHAYGCDAAIRFLKANWELTSQQRDALIAVLREEKQMFLDYAQNIDGNSGNFTPGGGEGGGGGGGGGR